MALVEFSEELAREACLMLFLAIVHQCEITHFSNCILVNECRVYCISQSTRFSSCKYIIWSQRDLVLNPNFLHSFLFIVVKSI